MKRMINCSFDDYIKITSKNWDDFLDKIEKETSLKVDSAYRNRHHGDKFIQLIDEDNGDIYEAEYTKYTDGSFEFLGYNLHHTGDYVDSSCHKSKIESSSEDIFQKFKDVKIKDSDWYRLITRIENQTGMKVVDGKFDTDRKYLVLEDSEGNTLEAELKHQIYYIFDGEYLYY